MKLRSCLAGVMVGLFFLLGTGTLYGVSDPAHHGQNLLKFKRYKEAERIFEKALEKNPKSANLHYSLGLAHFYQAEYRRAQRQLSKAVMLNPKHYEAFTVRGMVWFHTGKWAEALDDFDKAIDLNSRYAPAYNQLAWLHAVCPEERYRNGAKSVRLAMKAYEMDPILPYQDTLAAAYAEAGQFDKAIGLQKQVIRTLVEQEKTDKLDQYVIRLKQYEAGQPWRFEAAADRTVTGAKKDTQPSEQSVAGSGTSPKSEYPIVIEKDGAAVEDDAHLQDDTASTSDEAANKKVSMKYLTRKSNLGQLPQTGSPRGTSHAKALREVPPPQSEPSTANKETAGSVMGLFPTAAEQRATRYPYTVQVSSYPDAKKAHRVALGLRHRGDPAFTSPARIPGKGIWHRIFVGYYEDMTEARKAAKKLNQRRFRQTDVLMKPYALQVGLAHSESQLKQYLADLAKGGHLAYWAPDHHVAGKIRVLWGAYATAEEAEAFVESLRKLGFRPIVILR